MQLRLLRDTISAEPVVCKAIVSGFLAARVDLQLEALLTL